MNLLKYIINSTNKMEQLTKQTISENEQITKNIISISNDIIDVGTHTSAVIHGQGKQLEIMEDDIDIIKEQLQQSEKSLRRSHGCFPFKLPKIRLPKFHKKKRIVQSQTIYTKPVYKPVVIPDCDKINNNLNIIENKVQTAKAIALDMNAELTKQNILLGNLNSDLQSNSNKITSMNTKIDKLI